MLLGTVRRNPEFDAAPNEHHYLYDGGMEKHLSYVQNARQPFKDVVTRINDSSTDRHRGTILASLRLYTRAFHDCWLDSGCLLQPHPVVPWSILSGQDEAAIGIELEWRVWVMGVRGELEERSARTEFEIMMTAICRTMFSTVGDPQLDTYYQCCVDDMKSHPICCSFKRHAPVLFDGWIGR